MRERMYRLLLSGMIAMFGFTFFIKELNLTMLIVGVIKELDVGVVQTILIGQ